MTRIVTANNTAWYTRALLMVGVPLLFVLLLVALLTFMGGFSNGNQESISFTTEQGEQTTEGTVDSPLRVTLRVPWSTGNAETALSAVAIEILNDRGQPAKFGSEAAKPDGMKPALEIGVWVYDGSVPSEPGTYHVRVVMQRLYGASQTVELKQPVLAARAASGPPLMSGYVFARNANLWLLSTDTLRETRLTFLSSFFEYADNPAWSPDGKRLAYTFSPQTAPDQLPSTDIWTVGAENRDTYPAVRHSANEELLEPAWSSDGKSLYFTVRTTPSQDATPDPSGNFAQATRLDKIDLDTETRTQWMPNASMADGNAGGVVYVEKRSVPDSVSGVVDKYRLMWVKEDGSDNKMLIAENTYQEYYAPSISPDGKWVAFAAVNVPPITSSLETPNLVQSPRSKVQSRYSIDFGLWTWDFGQWFAPRPASAHGLPWDIFLVSTSGGAPIQLTQLNDDQPHVTWLNNTTIAFMGRTGLNKLFLDAGGKPVGLPSKIHIGALHGGLTWHAP